MSNYDWELIAGSIDMHCHAAPDFHPRIADELELLRDARSHGMRGIVSKSHYSPNASRLNLVNSQVDGARCYGGIVLNPPVGGLNPCAVETSIRFGGKVVWMPSFYSREHLRCFPQFKGVVQGPADGITILKDGGLAQEMHEILDLIANNNVILGTSHCSKEEIAVLVEQATKHKVKKIVVTHPYCPVPDLSLAEQEELVRKGAFLELCLYTAMPISGKVSIQDFARTIKKVGADHVVLATDFGQPFHPTPAEGMRLFCTSLLAVGVHKEEIDTMTKKNPSYLLDL
jgi:hypothetical protein